MCGLGWFVNNKLLIIFFVIIYLYTFIVCLLLLMVGCGYGVDRSFELVLGLGFLF